MPQQAWSAKRERQYEHIKEAREQGGGSTKRAKEIAARTVNKERARSGEAKTSSRLVARGHVVGAPRRLRSGTNRPKGRTKEQLYNEAKRMGIEGRSTHEQGAAAAGGRPEEVARAGPLGRPGGPGYAFAMQPKILDHVALWVAERDRDRRLRDAAPRHARDRADGRVHARRRRRAARQADAVRRRRAARARRARGTSRSASPTWTPRWRRCPRTGRRPRARRRLLRALRGAAARARRGARRSRLRLRPRRAVLAATRGDRGRVLARYGFDRGRAARGRAARRGRRRVARALARATRATPSGRCSTTSPCSSTRRTSTSRRRTSAGIEVERRRRRAEHVRRLPAGPDGVRIEYVEHKPTFALDVADLHRRRRRHGRARARRRARASSARRRWSTRRATRAGRVDAALELRHLAVPLDSRTSARECPGGDAALQRLIVERLDDALAWLESLGAPVTGARPATRARRACGSTPPG